MQLEPSYASRLRAELEELLLKFSPQLRDHAEQGDPISTVYLYDSPRDQEVVAFIASCLAYGSRKVFVPVIRHMLREMGRSPYEFVISGGYQNSFDWFSYRFNSSLDLRCLLLSLQKVLLSYGSLESAFLVDFDVKSDLRSHLSGFSQLFRGADLNPLGLSGEVPNGFLYLVPDPSKGSACKRLNMFLRWMVRKDKIDLGLWSGLEKSSLIIPLDTHVQKTSKLLKLTSKNSGSWATAVDITHSLLQVDPDDPLRYDFLLFSLGAWRKLESLHHVSS